MSIIIRMIYSRIWRNKVAYCLTVPTVISLIIYMFIVFSKTFDNFIPYVLFIIFFGLPFIFHKIIKAIIWNTPLPMEYFFTLLFETIIVFLILLICTSVFIKGKNIDAIDNINIIYNLKQIIYNFKDIIKFNEEIPLNSKQLDSYYFSLIFILTLIMSSTWTFMLTLNISISIYRRYFSDINFYIFLTISCTMSIYLIPFICNYGMGKQWQLYLFLFSTIIFSMIFFIITVIQLMTKIKKKSILWYSLSGIIILIVIAIIFGFFYYERGKVLQENELKKVTNWNDVCRYQIPFELGMAVVKEQEKFEKEEYGNKNGEEPIFSKCSNLNEFLNDLKLVYTNQSKFNKNVAISIIGRADQNPINVMGRKYNSNYELGKARAEGVKKIILDRNIINPNYISIISASSEKFLENSPAQREVIVVVKIANEIDPQNKYFGSLHQAFIYSIYAITGNSYDKLQHRDDLIIVIFSIIEFLFGIIIVTCIIGSMISS